MKYLDSGKRLVDLVISLTALVVLSPVLLVAAVLIVLDGGLPVIFSQDRVGKDRSTFRVYKFRSMRQGTGDIPSATAPVDAITRIGKILRRTNIDELPQLINVLKGDMSIVGPRPPLPSQTTLLETRSIHGGENLRPGLTGLAQINGYDGMTEEDKGHLDAEYASKVSLATDCLIIFKTVGHLFKKPPVY